MSLEAIRQLRHRRQKPDLVMVVIGDGVPPPLDEVRLVLVRPADQPSLMDWRPLVGVLVAVFTLQPQPDRTIAVFEALQAAGAKLVGAADQFGVYPLLEGDDEPQEVLLRRAWRLLCR